MTDKHLIYWVFKAAYAKDDSMSLLEALNSLEPPDWVRPALTQALQDFFTLKQSENE